MAHHIPCLVDSSWLKHRVAEGSVTVVDGTWHPPVTKRDAAAEHESCRIKGAVFFDLMKARDTSNPLPFMMPSPEQFEDYVGKLGISSDDHVVVYDNNAAFGVFSAARVWLMFQVMGHPSVSVLNGGLPEWNRNGGSTESGPAKQPKVASFKSKFQPKMLRTYEEMFENTEKKEALVIDARPPPRFDGSEPEPVPGLRGGHMIGAANVPFGCLINGATKLIKSVDDLKKEFTSRGVDLSAPTVAMCASGVTSSWLVLAAQHCQCPMMPLYDGAWTEWAKKAPDSLKKP